MPADSYRCPACGAERPADAPAGLCPHCMAPDARAGAPTLVAGDDNTVTLAETGSDPSGDRKQADRTSPATPFPEIPDLPARRPRGSGEVAAGISVAEFLRAVEELGLVDEADASAFLAKAAEARSSQDSRQLGRAMVAAGWLTAYQAGAICQGKAKGLIIGRYIVLEKLGAGGMGMVFKARHRRLKQAVALKILPPSLTRNPELLHRFQREAQTAARLNHRNIVRAIDADEAGGMHFLVMEFVEGANLSRLVKARGVRSPARAIDVMIQAARGLAVAHEAGIVHRDIKPSNLMIDASGVVKILDLGLARLNEELSSEGGAITLSGVLVGTVDYMSPEQAFDPRLADARSDIYSLGCTLYYLLTGRAPYGGSSLMQRLLAHREQPVPGVRPHRADVSPELDELFRKMVAKDPKDRPGSMNDLIARLEACKATAATSVRKGRPLMVFDEARRFEPPPLPQPASNSDASSVYVDPTPLPRVSATDLLSPRTGAGLRLDDQKRKIHVLQGSDILGFRSWIEYVRSRDAIPAGLSVLEGDGGPAFAALALPNRSGAAWDLAIHPDIRAFDVYHASMTLRGFALSLFAAYHVAPRSGIIGQFRQTDDVIDHALGLDLPAVPAALARIEKSAHRLIHLAAYPTPEGRRFAILSSRTSPRPQLHAYELTFDALRTFATRALLDGYVPLSLTACPAGWEPRFSIILEKVADRVCEMAFGLTQDELVSEFERRSRRGFSPIVLGGFDHEDAVLYNVGWIQGRLPKGW